jgi:hypothetical protein
MSIVPDTFNLRPTYRELSFYQSLEEITISVIMTPRYGERKRDSEVTLSLSALEAPRRRHVTGIRANREAASVTWVTICLLIGDGLCWGDACASVPTPIENRVED